MSDWEFPELEGPAVFIGSSNDVNYLRNIVKEEFKRLRREVADLRGVEYYAWEDEKFEKGWDHNRPYQASIPLTNDINCKAAIFVFGEQLGSPLPNHFPRTELASSPAIDDLAPHRLMPADSTTDGAGFPLTGTVFEYLVAQTNFDLPIKVLFFADQSIKEEVEVVKQAWGFRRLKIAKRKEYGEEGDNEFTEWRLTIYEPELERLRNFYRYITRDCGTPVDIVESEEQVSMLMRKFLVSVLDIKPSEQIPFKYLQVYGERDGASFFGRKSIRKQIVQNLVESVDAPTEDRRPFYCIYGASGAGKSSVLRAGVVAHMAHSISAGKWVTCTIRPSELGEAPGLLVSLHHHCMTAIGAVEERQIPMVPMADIFPECQVADMLKDIQMALSQLPANEKMPWRLLLGIDQLEEAVSEYLDSSAGVEKWQHFFDFIDKATMTGRIAVVSSIPQSWFTEMIQNARLKSLVESGSSKPIGFPIHQVEDIIEQSFGLVIPNLSAVLKDKLLNSITELYESSKGNDSGAILPLLSLAMSRIYERWKEQTTDKETPEINFEAAGGGEVSDSLEEEYKLIAKDPNDLSLEDYGDLAELESIIDDLGEAAFEQAKATIGPSFLEEESLWEVFRPMVTLLKGDEIALRNTARPKDHSASALLDSLCANRLIMTVEGNKYRLVHERVLRLWARLAKWKDEERRRLTYVRKIRDRLSDWKEDGRDWRDPATLSRLGLDDMEGAAEVLYAWSSTLAPVNGTVPVNGDYGELRDVLTAILARQATPREIIETLDKKPSHFYAAVASGICDLVKSYLERDTELAHLKRQTDDRTALFVAAFNDRTEILEILIDAATSPKKCDKDNWYPLHIAAARGNIGATELLIKACHDVDLLGGPERKVTPLNSACSNGHINVARVLLKQSADPNKLGHKNWGALHHAAHKDNTELVQLLLKYDANPSLKIDAGWSSYLLACRNGSPETVQLIIEHEKTDRLETTGNWSPLELAVFGGNVGSMQVLLSYQELDRFHENPRKHSLLQLAITEKRLDMLECLLADDQVDIDAKGPDEGSALHQAVKEGYFEALEFLLANKAAVDVTNKLKDCPLHVAVKDNHLKVAELIVEAAPDQIDILNDGKHTALHLATIRGQKAIVQMLLSHGAKLTEPDSQGMSLLHYAVRLKDTTILSLFLTSAPELIDVRDLYGRTPLHYAAELGFINPMKLMIRRSSSILFEIDDKGLTAFHLAIRHNQLDGARYLLGQNSELSLRRDHEGWMPIHTAAQFSHQTAVEWLLDEGQDVNVLSRKPELALVHIAAEQDDVELVDLVSKHHANLNQTTADRRIPLLVALTNGSLDAALRLLERGADLQDARQASAVLRGYFERLRQQHSVLPDNEKFERLAESGIQVSSTEGYLQGDWPFPQISTRSLIPDEVIQVSSTIPSTLFENLSWQALDAKNLIELERRLDPIDGKYKFDADMVTGHIASLPWYSQAKLMRFTSPVWSRRHLAIYYLADQGNLFRLNGTSPPIHEVNSKAPIQLNAENVQEYLRFFSFFVRGDEGPFYILESMEDPVVNVEMDSKVRSVFEGTIRPMSLEGMDQQGRFLCDGVIWYSNAMFIGNFAIESSGMVHLLNDVPIAGDLPVKVDRPIA
ncbi:MAG: ankyrin repeat domain-containing protein [Ketobacter sp.]|nr:ankyrin repeat domain-containing protein [Ketobacter sp.]